MSKKQQKTDKAQNKPEKARKKNKLRIHEVTAENDIRYRGPLSFQQFQIAGWLCIALTQLVVVLKLIGRIDSSFAESSNDLTGVISGISSLSLPLLLISNFAQILNAGSSYRKLMIRNFAAMAGICLLYYIVFYHYLAGGLKVFLTDPSQTSATIQTALSLGLANGFFCFNIFVDLFLCTLVMYFLNHQPPQIFHGRSVIVFRLLALLPVGYEIVCMVLKIRAVRHLIQIPVWAYPLLPVKPPMTFVLFIFLAIFVKTREHRFRRHGRTHEEYQAFLNTRRNSWNFSVFLSIMIVVISLLDLIIVFGFALNEGVQEARSVENGTAVVVLSSLDSEDIHTDSYDFSAPAGESEDSSFSLSSGIRDGLTVKKSLNELSEDELSDFLEGSMLKGASVASAVGFGDSIYMLFLAPFVLLFSYTRKPKWPLVSTLVPVAGVMLILVIYLEGIHQGILHLNISNKIDPAELKELTISLLSTLQQ